MKTTYISIIYKKLPDPGAAYWAITVDGIAFEEYLHAQFPEQRFIELVTTLLNWLENFLEQKIVWERVLPRVGTSTNLPILMCQEDLDFSCSLVIVEATSDDEYYYWTKMGYDNTTEYWRDLSTIGSQVNWLPDFGPLRFEKAQYEAVVAEFRSMLEPDTQTYWNR